MKIYNLKIKNPSGEILRDIPFNKVGISFIYGDVQEPKNLNATINSLGKTLLLKCIDYIFGAKEDGKIIKEDIHGFEIEAVVSYNNKEYSIRRTLGNSDSIFVDGKKYSLSDYKEFFSIKRSLYTKQFVLTKKTDIISSSAKTNKEDVLNYLDLIQLNDMIENVKNIYQSQDTITKYKGNKSDLISFYGELNERQIDEEIYFVDKEVGRLTVELERISEKIKNLEVSEMQQNIIEEFSEKSKSLKMLKIEYEKNKLECDRLLEFIKNSNKADITAEHILTIFEKTKQEVPQMVKKSLNDVEMFHQKVYEERKIFLNSKKETIEKDMLVLIEKMKSLSNDIDNLGSIISVNKVYQESVELYEKYNRELQDLKYKEGKLSQVKDIDYNIEKEDKKLTYCFDNINETRKCYDEIIQLYRNFIYDITKMIYDNDVNSYFDIEVRKKSLKNRPIVFTFNLKGDTGEGVNEVKKNLMDYLVFKYNTYMEIMIQDSSCYNGIDPRQVSGMMIQLDKIADENQKQVIIAINKYQVGDYKNTIDFIEDKSVITLHENDNLLRFEF